MSGLRPANSPLAVGSPVGAARRHSREKLYVIKSFSYDGTLIYTKGTIVNEEGEETFYIFVSWKIATLGDYADF